MPTEADQPVPARVHLRSLSEDVLIEQPDQGESRLRAVTRWGEFVIDEVTAPIRDALERMSMGPNSVTNIEPPTPDERARLTRILDTLSGSVVHTLHLDDGGGELLSVVPTAERARFRMVTVDHGQPLRLSRFAAIRTGRDELVLESSVAPFQVALHRALAYRVVISLGIATSVTELASTLRVPLPVVTDLVGYLVAAGVVLLGSWLPAGSPPGATFGEDIDPTLAKWSHHDLMFHARTRNGHDPQARPPAAGGDPPPPVTKPVPAGPRFSLYRPQPGELADHEPSLTEVIEADQVCPKVSDRPLERRQLGELLYRAARVRSVSASPVSGVTYETSERPYLSIAGLYELELYLTINRCAELPRGIYHYDPTGHFLTLINDSETDLERLLDSAKIAARRDERPSALITVTARADRLLSLASGAGYATTLMHLGALQQTLHLVATVAGLASCPLSLDTSDSTDRALRLDWPTEVGIGECIIGHRDQP
ncbi:SagB family peptide dehydrogenase [Actinophytocola sediminis]